MLERTQPEIVIIIIIIVVVKNRLTLFRSENSVGSRLQKVKTRPVLKIGFIITLPKYTLFEC